jgi:hypothetical protein
VTLPESKVFGVALGVGGIIAPSKILNTLVSEFSVAGPAGDVEIHVPGPIVRGISVTSSNELTNELNHGGDIAGCPRLTGGRKNV